MKQQPASSPVQLVSSAITRIFRFQVHHFLSRAIVKGSLIFTADDEPPVLFGQTPEAASNSAHPVASLHLANPPSFYARVASQADIGFAEAYMAADFTIPTPDHLLPIFRILILNRDQTSLSASSILLSRVGAYANAALSALNRNTLSGSRRNIEAHYDLSNALFATFLGNTWVYSCAIFAPGRSLDDAQTAKIDAILSKACLHKRHHILDIGCGWGELAIRAAITFGCRVKGITLSREQLSLARQRAVEAEVDSLVDFELVDYRVLAQRGVRYDRVISVEMAEAVGHEFLGDYFKAIDDVLQTDGVAVIQVITTPEARYEAYRTSVDFIQKHIFPGGICPSLEAMVTAMARSSQLMIESVDNIGPHYATTLAEWRRRFLKSVQNGLVQDAGFDDVFIRRWLYYLCYCQSGFETRTLGTLQIVLTRAGNVEALGSPPMCS